jgi:HSP20 family protein
MSLELWNPYQDLEHWFDKYGRSSRGSITKNAKFELGDWIPSVDIDESSDNFVVKAELPGVAKDDIKVDINNGILTIKGEKRAVSDKKDKNCHRKECSYGSFVRSFTLPHEVQEDKIDASFKDGILSLMIPKSEKAKPKQIDIKVK